LLLCVLELQTAPSLPFILCCKEAAYILVLAVVLRAGVATKLKITKTP
jgi:hypothetical protein